MYHSHRHLVLFDIDGTLVLTGGAGLRAMNRACEHLVGHQSALDGVTLAGRTDWIILDNALTNNGLALDPALLSELRRRYVEHLREEIELPGKGVKAVMPGIRDLLDALASRADMALGLLTGNFEEGARIKLEHFDLWKYFRCGAYGDDASDRNHLVPIAMQRAKDCGLADASPSQVFVIGDTPHDVACAHAAGATPIGVATGSYTVDQLRAAGAEIAFEDLSDTPAVVRVLEGVAK
jgi:phosphoglycolate phosphatase-like HAD superfamily hydrolase